MVVSVVGGDMVGDSSNYLWRLRHNTARPDIVGADQPQPVDALFVGQVRCTWRSSVHAAPAAAWINLKEWERGFSPGHSGIRRQARARNPYSRSWLRIPGSLALPAPRN